MAYASSALECIVQRTGASKAIWNYSSTADALATVVGANYFSDAYDKGVKKYDICFLTDNGGSTTIAVGMFTAVTASSAATLTVGNLSSTI